MELDLQAFDDRPYDAILARLKSEGFRFTSMAESGGYRRKPGANSMP